ncbi:MAG: imidazoleglycerol-phosphate dehydratase HisB [Oscillospiraceae bacterium]|nr:imidazoleglycerol-phosphate dehydratase HisB [Oscillospiraceae bacterium]
MREKSVNRKTAETDIQLYLALDGGDCDFTEPLTIDSGVGFLDHMLSLFSRHSGFGLGLKCVGDTRVDDHHSVEDIGIALGEAISGALDDKRGITRYGSIILPMDEALVLCAVDLSGRSCLRYNVDIPTEKIGSFDTELVEEFFQGLVRSSGMTLHIKMLDGTNSHHIAEAVFKAFGRALKQAAAIDPELDGAIPSTKGIL